MALVRLDVGAAIAHIVEIAISFDAALKLLVGEHRAMNVEVDDVIIADAVPRRDLAQMCVERLVAAGAQDLDLHRHVRATQRLDQRARDRAVAHVVRTLGPRGDDQQIDRWRGAHAGLDRLRVQVLAHHRPFDRERAWQRRVLQRFPVQPVKLRRSGDLEGQAARAGLQRRIVARVGLAVGEDLVEQPLAIGADASRRLARLDLFGEGEAQMLLEIPLQPLLLLCGEWAGDADWVLALAVEADGGVRAVRRFGMFANADHSHRWLRRWKRET